MKKNIVFNLKEKRLTLLKTVIIKSGQPTPLLKTKKTCVYLKTDGVKWLAMWKCIRRKTLLLAMLAMAETVKLLQPFKTLITTSVTNEINFTGSYFHQKTNTC